MNVISQHDRRHPWRSAFLKDPDRELERLLAGYAMIEDLSAAQPGDVVRAVFGLPGQDSEGVEALDHAVLAWLRARRIEGRRPLPHWGRPRALHAIIDALDIIGVMQLPASAIEINRRMSVWYRWAERLGKTGTPDVLAALLTATALTQRLVARQPGGGASVLEAFWLDLAAGAGSVAPESYLQHALLGLRRLPERDAPPERTWMTGLARWAESQRPTAREFAFEWRGLRALYPHTPAYWRDLLQDTLDQHSIERLPAEIRNVWQNDLGWTASAGEKTGRRRVKPIPTPPIKDVKDLERQLHLPLANIQAELQRVFAERTRYAEATGEDYFLVTTICNLGQQLLSKSPVGEEARRGQLMQKAARLALRWQPGNSYAWALWRDSVFVQGYIDDAEAIGWASISRFPEYRQLRSQLADILVRSSEKRSTAKMLLTESLSRFPDDTFRHQLAELLIATGETDDARSLVADSWVAEATTYTIQARIAFQSDHEEAARIVERGLKKFPDSNALRAYDGILKSGGKLYLLSELYGKPDVESKGSLNSEDELLLSARREGRSRRLQTELTYLESDEQWRARAISMVELELTEYPESKILRYLAGRLGVSGTLEHDGPTGFSVELAIALAVKSTDMPLSQPASPFEQAITDVSLIYLRGDNDACERVSAWLQEPAPTLRSRQALRQFLITRTGGRSDKDSLKALAANDNLAADIIETALIPTQLALAA
ncbi:MAG TPA: hypothetical protein VD906_00880 [Caulobacteraceae bacterium]|nr:hypothetical protein [Caulobacteraceae bacterium]